MSLKPPTISPDLPFPPLLNAILQRVLETKRLPAFATRARYTITNAWCTR
jgi:hypothetical protein